jgi:membrane-associated phospholipid phosphatase
LSIGQFGGDPEILPANNIVADLDKHDNNLLKNIDDERASEFIAGRRAQLFQAYVFVAAIGFIVLAFFANKIAYFPLDLAITRWVQTFHPAWFVTFMLLVSWPGYFPQAPVLVILAVSLLYFSGFRWEAITSCGAVIIQTILDGAIKIIIHRPRPASNLVNVITVLQSYSFPSGHVLFYSVFLGFLVFIVYSRLKASGLRSALLLLFGTMIILVGISRIYLGEHWASDVLGAYLLGSLCLLAMIQIYRWGEKIRNLK